MDLKKLRPSCLVYLTRMQGRSEQMFDCSLYSNFESESSDAGYGCPEEVMQLEHSYNDTYSLTCNTKLSIDEVEMSDYTLINSTLDSSDISLLDGNISLNQSINRNKRKMTHLEGTPTKRRKVTALSIKFTNFISSDSDPLEGEEVELVVQKTPQLMSEPHHYFQQFLTEPCCTLPSPHKLQDTPQLRTRQINTHLCRLDFDPLFSDE